MSLHLQSVARAVSKAAIIVAVSSAAVATQAQTGQFSGLAGSWSGNGTISMTNGSTERLHCRVSYEVAPSGTSLYQQLRCASDATKFEVQSRVTLADGQLSGTWTETTRNATGAISGTVSGGDIRTHVDGTGFTADLDIITKGDRQSVLIRPQGADVREVKVDFRRG